MTGVRVNRVAYPDHVVWQGTRLGRLAGNAAMGLGLIVLSVPLIVLAVTSSPRDPTKALVFSTLLLVAGILLLAGAGWRTRVQSGRRFVIRHDAVVLVDGEQVMPIAWDAIAAVHLGLAVGERTNLGTVTLRVTLRDDSVQFRRMGYVEEGMFRALALDLCQGLAGRPAQFTVHGPQVIADEVAARMAAGRQPGLAWP